MNSIDHDHMYLKKFERVIKSNEMPNFLNEKNHRHRIIRSKCDIQTDEDRIEYARRRTLNNVSCRMSRIHRRSKFDFMIQKCIEYEELNEKFNIQIQSLTQVIDQFKQHLRTLMNDSHQ